MASSSSLVLKLACIVIMGLVLANEPPRAHAMSCGRFLDKFSKCNQYARGGALEPACCQGLRDIKREDTTKAARQQSCNCMVGILNNVPGLIPSRALEIPTLCREPMPYPISTTANCNK